MSNIVVARARGGERSIDEPSSDATRDALAAVDRERAGRDAAAQCVACRAGPPCSGSFHLPGP
jgi:hypothetical protein